jgi:hypothetical protein
MYLSIAAIPRADNIRVRMHHDGADRVRLIDIGTATLHASDHAVITLHVSDRGIIDALRAALDEISADMGPEIAPDAHLDDVGD